MPAFRFTASGYMVRTVLPVLAAVLMAAPLHAQAACPATLADHVLLPARTFIPALKDAPADLGIELILLEVGDFLKPQ